MADQVSTPRSATRIAVMVLDPGTGPIPCPFFAKCDGIMVRDTDTGVRRFHRNSLRTPQSMCDLILTTGASGLVCGFIGASEIRRLRAAGIDVRLSAGRRSIEELVTCFCDLPEA